MFKRIFIVTALLLLSSCLFAGGQVKNCSDFAGGECQDFNDEGAGTVISQIHDQIEKENAFKGTYYWADIDTPEGVTLTVVVPDGVEIHCRIAILAEDQALTWTLKKNLTSIDNSGTTLTPQGNCFITSAAVSPVSWYIDTDVSVGGTDSGIGGRVAADKNQFTGSFDDVDETPMGTGIHSYWFVPDIDNGKLTIIIFWYVPNRD